MQGSRLPPCDQSSDRKWVATCTFCSINDQALLTHCPLNAVHFCFRRAKNDASSVAFRASLSSRNILYSEHHASETVLVNLPLAQLLRSLSLTL
jgi:hypothetical protein